MAAHGTSPPGTRDEREAASWVRAMFGGVAHRYDLLNHLLSMNFDRYWRARTVRRVAPWLAKPGVHTLDLCCGTGDLLISLEHAAGAPCIGADFCHPMLAAASRKIARRKHGSQLVEADALALPFPDSSLDLVTTAFGFRNLANYDRGLAEMRRVLKPGGAAAILEFSQPVNPTFASLYAFYSRKVLPKVGGFLSGNRNAYEYLPESVRKFPTAADLAVRMQNNGFSAVDYELLTGGIVALHIGIVPE